ncbi:hypothetical protein CHUAL_013357 [Chamberlinius hualienensis]
MAEEKAKIAFGFSKKADKRFLSDSIIRDDASKDVTENTDYVLSISKTKIESTASKDTKAKKDLVIPMIVKNNWRIPNTTPGSNVKAHEDKNDLESQAIKEILEDIRKSSDIGDGTGKKDPNMVIPMYVQNKVPEGYETNDRLDVSIRAEESTQEDYDSVPVEDFGMAMIRGMGWKPGEGIGIKFKKVFTPCEVVVRPKGLGLGANPKMKMNQNKNSSNSKENGEEINQLKVGVYVRLLSGPSKGLYGEVISLDFENARVVVKLTITSENVTISELYVKVVSASEYKKEGKLINKAKYEEYKAKEEEKHKRERRSDSKRSESHRSSSDAETHHHKRKHSPENKKRSSSKHSKEDHQSRKSSQEPSWVYPLLRVRFIDKRYKNGEYYNTKIVIDDVINKGLCICRTDKGRILEDIKQEWLETIIPKSSPAIVMVVQGSNKGQIGEILDKNKKKCTAAVQLLQDKNLVQLDYDSICEYVGKITDY